MNNYEAITAFVAWLTTRETKLEIGKTSDCAGLPDLIVEFCKANNIEINVSDDWPDNFKHP